jgi:hypothetical protein
VTVVDPYEETGGLHVLFGGEFDRSYVQIGRTWDGYEALWSIGDLDGDGLDDLIAGGDDNATQHDFAWISGASLRAADGAATIWEVAYAHMSSPGYLLGTGWASLPDIDRDGVDELVLTAAEDPLDIEDDNILFLDPRARGAFAPGDALGGYSSGPAFRELGYHLYPCTAFGGPAVVANSGLDIVMWPMPAEIPPLGSPVPERHLSYIGFQRFSNCRDVTGDGVEDIALTVDVADNPDSDSLLTILPGWNLDWNDDALWAE